MNIRERRFTTKFPSPPPEEEDIPCEKIEKAPSINNNAIQSKFFQLPSIRLPFIRLPFILIKQRIRFSKPVLTISKTLMEIDGRDKMMKLTQYFIRIMLYYQIVYAKHWSLATKQLSMTRKLLRLGNVVRSYYRITTEKPLSMYSTFILCNTIVNQVADDIFCFYKLDFIDSYWGLRAEFLASCCWLTNTIFDIWVNKDTLKSNQLELVKERSADKINDLKQKIFVNKISMVKLFMDAIFCVCDIWKPSYSPVLQSWSGFISATMAVTNLWIKNSE